MTDIDVMDNVEKLPPGSSKLKWFVLLTLLSGSFMLLFFSAFSEWFLPLGSADLAASIFLFDMSTLR